MKNAFWISWKIESCSGEFQSRAITKNEAAFLAGKHFKTKNWKTYSSFPILKISVLLKGTNSFPRPSTPKTQCKHLLSYPARRILKRKIYTFPRYHEFHRAGYCVSEEHMQVTQTYGVSFFIFFYICWETLQTAARFLCTASHEHKKVVWVHGDVGSYWVTCLFSSFFSWVRRWRTRKKKKMLADPGNPQSQ